MSPNDRYEDPFLALSSEQQMDLSVVAQIRERIKRDDDVPHYILDDLENRQQSLLEQGIDVDGLLSQREAIKAKRQAAASATNDAIDGRNVRMPGYMLPIDFDGEQVIEFLLVPFIGACIHVPPPPPNQIVHVKLQSGYRSKGLYSPVWVQGRIRVGKISKDLYLVDGTSNIPMSYSLLAENIEAYDP